MPYFVKGRARLCWSTGPLKHMKREMPRETSKIRILHIRWSLRWRGVSRLERRVTPNRGGPFFASISVVPDAR